MSPSFLSEKGFRFSIHSNEENRAHVHVFKDDNEAKIWLEPNVELDSNYGFKKKELQTALEIVNEHAEDFRKKYRDYIR